ncbi:2-dehydropantoate 2-reductase [Pseudomonas sp. RIT411]|uniref:ketopantoate reductase family protein n=1 Tax=Pseudomonas sp. RIT411 TaxID=2202160 RepID=UPI000D38C772|nr:2-dehydropantoate 2-reductase [Pseudomonas sp. RIT 411]RAU33329.1 2-dehydropantoate 2-reductase [Pseudomonas sp. RIT 411]
MKIAIVGAGAMGGLFGARLALAGQEVSFVEASAQAIEVISRQGLRLETPEVQTTVQVPIARAAQFSGSFDLLVIFTKGFHTAAAIDSVRHLVGPDTWALSVQNGLGNADIIASVVPAERVIVGMTNLPADLVAPGVIHSQGEGHINLWSFNGEDASRVHEVATVFSQAGLPCTADSQVQVAIWEKVAFNAALNSVCAVTRQTVGAVGRSAYGRQVLGNLVEETLAVARAAGIAVDRRRVEAAVDYALANHQQHKPSMLQDLEAGRKTEIDFINGAVVAQGKRLEVPTLVLQALYNLVKVSEGQGQGQGQG